MAARRSFYYGSNKQDAVKKLQEVATLVKEAEALLIKADKLSREAKIPFRYAYASSDAIDTMAESAEWVASTCTGGGQGDHWTHITGTPKEREFERDDYGYVIEGDDEEE